MNEPNNTIGIKASHEDKITKTREFIRELTKVQELYYESLKAKLGLSDEVEGFLWDYIFNDISYHTFEEFLSEYGSIKDNTLKTKFKIFNIYKL